MHTDQSVKNNRKIYNTKLWIFQVTSVRKQHTRMIIGFSVNKDSNKHGQAIPLSFTTAVRNLVKEQADLSEKINSNII